MNLHFDFSVGDNISFTLPCLILNLYHDTPAKSAVYSLVSKKIFQNDEVDDYDEGEDDGEKICENSDENAHFISEAMK